MNFNTRPIEFGAELIRTLDLDPVYVALRFGLSSPGQLARACTAYWMYYHLGVAAKLSEAEGSHFWRAAAKALLIAPRGTERRHFRGVRGLDAIQALEKRFPGGAEELVAYLVTPEKSPLCNSPAQEGPSGPRNRGKVPLKAPDAALGLKTARYAVRKRTDLRFGTVRDRVMELPQFGPWIAFKVADMLERVLRIPVDFSDCRLLEFYDEPKAGAELAAKLWKLPTPQGAIDKMLFHFREKSPTKAPPCGNRMINIQEVETILCKWKAHTRGHYGIGKDTQEVVHGLHGCKSATGARLLNALESHSPILLQQKERALV